MKRIGLCLAMAITCVSCAGPGQQAKLREISIGGKTVSYTFQSCAPQVKWDGFDVKIEDIKMPSVADKNPFQFTVGKIGYEQKAIRDINTSVMRYDSLMQACCSTLVRLKNEESILKYSLHRDALFSQLISYLETLDKTNNQEEAGKITADAFKKADQLQTGFEKDITKKP